MYANPPSERICPSLAVVQPSENIPSRLPYTKQDRTNKVAESAIRTEKVLLGCLRGNTVTEAFRGPWSSGRLQHAASPSPREWGRCWRGRLGPRRGAMGENDPAVIYPEGRVDGLPSAPIPRVRYEAQGDKLGPVVLVSDGDNEFVKHIQGLIPRWIAEP